METTIECSGIAPKAKKAFRGGLLREHIAADSANLPQDARDWVDPCTLALWVQEETEPLGSTVLDNEPTGYYYVTMSRVLVYAYAIHLLPSDEVSQATRTDPALQWLSGGQAPFAEEITTFRRRHRLQLESLLTRVLARVAVSRIGEDGEVGYPALLQRAKERLDTARHLDSGD